MQESVVALVIARRDCGNCWSWLKKRSIRLRLRQRCGSNAGKRLRVDKRGEALARRHQPNIGKDTARGHFGPQRIVVVSTVREGFDQGCGLRRRLLAASA
jgi:hypothetical protein